MKKLALLLLSLFCLLLTGCFRFSLSSRAEKFQTQMEAGSTIYLSLDEFIKDPQQINKDLAASLTEEDLDFYNDNFSSDSQFVRFEEKIVRSDEDKPVISTVYFYGLLENGTISRIVSIAIVNQDKERFSGAVQYHLESPTKLHYTINGSIIASSGTSSEKTLLIDEGSQGEYRVGPSLISDPILGSVYAHRDIYLP